MTVQALLAGKQSEIKTVGPKVHVETVAAVLHENRIGALPVIDERDTLVGIISERDIIRVVALHGTAALSLTVDRVMTRGVVTVTPQASIKDVMATMTSRRIRHLPVIEAGRLKGVISIGDVIKHRLDTTEMEVNVLRDYAISKS